MTKGDGEASKRKGEPIKNQCKKKKGTQICRVLDKLNGFQNGW